MIFKRMPRRALCLVIAAWLIICLNGCLGKRSKEEPYAFYLKAGEPAPIEGWLIKKEVFTDLFVDAVKRKLD